MLYVSKLKAKFRILLKKAHLFRSDSAQRQVPGVPRLGKQTQDPPRTERHHRHLRHPLAVQVRLVLALEHSARLEESSGLGRLPGEHEGFGLALEDWQLVEHWAGLGHLPEARVHFGEVLEHWQPVEDWAGLGRLPGEQEGFGLALEDWPRVEDWAGLGRLPGEQEGFGLAQEDCPAADSQRLRLRFARQLQ
jgi:hypothetical protein